MALFGVKLMWLKLKIIVTTLFGIYYCVDVVKILNNCHILEILRVKLRFKGF